MGWQHAYPSIMQITSGFDISLLQIPGYHLELVLVKLIGVNKGRRVNLKYFSILIKVSRKHRLFLAPGQSIILICVVVK